MTYQFTGKLLKVGNVVPCTGKIKEKCTFIVRNDDEGREIAFVLFDEKINLYLEPLEKGDKIEVSFTIKSREFIHNGVNTGDYSTVCYAMSVTKIEEKKSGRSGRDRYKQREEQQQRDNAWDSWGKNQNNRNRSHNPNDPPPWESKTSGTDYFVGCKTSEEAKKRYRKLSLEHHPDKPAGSTEKMQEINKQYERWR